MDSGVDVLVICSGDDESMIDSGRNEFVMDSTHDESSPLIIRNYSTQLFCIK